MKHQRLHEVAC